MGKNTSKASKAKPALPEPLGRYLIKLFTHFEKELFERIHETTEFASVGSADHKILRCLGGAGMSVNEIAGITGTTKQAVSKAVGSLEERGFVRKKSDDVDGRRQVVEFTAKGWRLYERGMSIVAEIEKRYERIIGGAELELAKQSLALLIDSYAQERTEA